MNGGLSQYVRVLDSIERATPNQTWLASIDFDALKAKWAAEEEQENDNES
jgi:preprotein translocase subunit SecB